jgi:uncharacterized membrane protein
VADNDPHQKGRETDMTNDVPTQVIVAAFDGKDSAKEAFDDLKQLEKEKSIKIENAAILQKDDDLKLHIRDVKDMTGTRGVVLGGVAGAVLGAITGPVGWVALGGAAIGGLVAKLSDGGFDNSRLEQWGANLGPGDSGLVAVIDHTWVRDVEAALEEDARDVMTLEIGDEIAAQLESG